MNSHFFVVVFVYFFLLPKEKRNSIGDGTPQNLFKVNWKRTIKLVTKRDRVRKKNRIKTLPFK